MMPQLINCIVTALGGKVTALGGANANPLEAVTNSVTGESFCSPTLKALMGESNRFISFREKIYVPVVILNRYGNLMKPVFISTLLFMIALMARGAHV